MKAGFAVKDITPEIGIYLTGYGQPERLATGVHLPLRASVMVLSDNGVETAVIGLDWCFVDWELTRKIRECITGKTGIPGQNILLCCSHTHSAPHTTYMRTLGRVAVDPENRGVEYAIEFAPVIADAVLEAKQSMCEIVAGFNAGKTRTGVSRRATDIEGKVSRFIGDPNAIYDDNMTAVRFLDRKTSRDVGIVIHCTAHNTAMGGDRRYSSDWCGVMKQRIEKRYHVPVVFLNGGFGDVGPRTNYWVDFGKQRGFSAGGGDGPDSAAEVGYRAASDALALLEEIRDFRSEMPLRVHTAQISLPQEIPISKAQAEEIMRRFDESSEKTDEPPVDYQLAETALKTWAEPPQPVFQFEQTVLAFGPVALAPFPFEMFSIFSLRLRKFGPFPYTLLCSNTNGRNAYMPDRGAIAAGGYEASCRKTIRPYVMKPEAGDLAVTQTLDSLRQLL